MAGAMKRPSRGGKYFFEYDVGLWNFGTVQVYKDREQGVLRTCKTVEKNRLRIASTDVLTRLQALQSLKHPHVASIVEIIEEPSSFFIVSEFCSGGDIDYWIQEVQHQEQNTCIDEATCCGYTRQALLALVFCEQNGVQHGDLRPSSLQLSSKSSDAVVKVADFGLVSVLDKDRTIIRRAISPYMAPEVVEGSSQAMGNSPDLYSLGAIAHALLVGQPPAACGPVNSGVLAGMSRLLTSRGDEWAERSPMSHDFVQQLLLPANERPTAARALQHPWMKALMPSGPEVVMEDFPSKILCYMVAVLLLPVAVPYADFEKLQWGFASSDSDGDGLVNTAAAQRLLQTRSMSKEGARAALLIADVGNTGVLDLCGTAVADLLGRELMGHGPLQAGAASERILRLFFDTYGANRPAVTCDHIRARLRTATWREVERSCGVDYDEVLTCLPEGCPVDSQVLTSQLVQYGGLGTPLGGSMPDQEPEGDLFGLHGIDDVLGGIFKACGLGRHIDASHRADETRCM
jgi:hypothetical protein